MNSFINKKTLEKTIDEIRELALSYLDKYSCSKQQIKIYLLKKWISKNKSIRDKKDILKIIDAVILSLEKNNLISNKLYSDSNTKKFIRRGYSINKIKSVLFKKGIEDEYIKESISKVTEGDNNPDYFSAIKHCKRRNIGPFRNESNRSLFYKKDISILARAGFSYETSKKILDISKDKLKKMLSFM